MIDHKVRAGRSTGQRGDGWLARYWEKPCRSMVCFVVLIVWLEIGCGCFGYKPRTAQGGEAGEGDARYFDDGLMTWEKVWRSEKPFVDCVWAVGAHVSQINVRGGGRRGYFNVHVMAPAFLIRNTPINMEKWRRGSLQPKAEAVVQSSEF